MNTAQAKRETLSSYAEIIRTFTYDILATLPAFLIYDFGILLINLGNQGKWHLNGMHGVMEKLFLRFGFPTETSFFFLVILMTFLYRYEQARKEVRIQPFFFVKTFTESLFLSAGMAALVLFLLRTGLYYPKELWGQGVIEKQAMLPTIIHACGDGFYEGITVASIINFLLLNTPKSQWWHAVDLFFSIAFAALVFSLIHSPELLGLSDVSFDTDVFLYKIGLGVIWGGIYIVRGFATMVWVHVFFNFWLLSVLL